MEKLFPIDKEDYRSNLYDTSKSGKEETYLLDRKYDHINAYNLDEVAKDYSKDYRKGQTLSSCDAFYENKYHDCFVIEFKNTNHLAFRQFMDGLYRKLADSHMLLLEAFYRNKNAEAT